MEVSFSEVSRETHIPSVSASSSFAGLLYEFGENLKKDLSVCTPAIVYKYEIENGTAYVRPLVAEQEDTGSFRMKPIVRVTVMQHQYGGFYMHSPLNVGDTGWLIAADTDTDLIKERNSFVQGENSGIGAKDKTTGKPLSNQGPQISENDVRHQASQGFFIPDKWGGIQLPDELRRSLVIQQISPDQTTHGRFAIDQDGKIHILSERWRDDNDKLSGGLVDIDLRFKDINPVNNQPYWSSGEIESFATAIIKGDETIKSWTDEFGKSHGGNLAVEKNVNVGENLDVSGSAHIKGEVQVASTSLFNQKVVVKTDNKAAIIDPKTDLYKTDARFREVTVVTGFKEKDTANNVVKLQAKKMRVLTDIPEDTTDVEFEVGGDSGGGDSGGEVITDNNSIRFHTIDDSGVNKLEIKGWNDDSQNATTYLEDLRVSSNFYLLARAGTETRFIPMHRIPQLVFHYNYTSKKIINCRCLAGRETVTCDDFSIANNYNGPVYAVLKHPVDGSPSLSLSTSYQENDEETTCWQIYRFSDGIIVDDFRGIPTIPLYE